MTTLETTLRDIVRELDGLGARFALVGGLAVSARTEPRFTRDVDLAVAVDSDEEAEQLVRDLRGAGYEVSFHLEQTATARLATVRLSRGAAVLDLLFASSGVEPEVVADAEPLEVFPGLTVPVATVSHLLALKILARDDSERPQDRADAVALVRTATDAELATTRDTLATISARGYDRGRDLERELEQLLAE